MVRLIMFMYELLRMLRMMRMTLQRKVCSKAALVKAHTRARLLTESQRKLCKENPGPALLFHFTWTWCKGLQGFKWKSTPRSKCKQVFLQFFRIVCNPPVNGLFSSHWLLSLKAFSSNIDDIDIRPRCNQQQLAWMDLVTVLGNQSLTFMLTLGWNVI